MMTDFSNYDYPDPEDIRRSLGNDMEAVDRILKRYRTYAIRVIKTEIVRSYYDNNVFDIEDIYQNATIKIWCRDLPKFTEERPIEEMLEEMYGNRD